MNLPSDKVQHFVVCGLLAFVMATFLSLLSGDYICGVVSGFVTGIAAGLGKEYGDEQCENNQWDWLDVLADAVGSLSGAFIGALAALMS